MFCVFVVLKCFIFSLAFSEFSICMFLYIDTVYDFIRLVLFLRYHAGRLDRKNVSEMAYFTWRHCKCKTLTVM